MQTVFEPGLSSPIATPSIVEKSFIGQNSGKSDLAYETCVSVGVDRTRQQFSPRLMTPYEVLPDVSNDSDC